MPLLHALLLHAVREQNYPGFLGLSPQSANGMLAANEFVPLSEERERRTTICSPTALLKAEARNAVMTIAHCIDLFLLFSVKFQISLCYCSRSQYT